MCFNVELVKYMELWQIYVIIAWMFLFLDKLIPCPFFTGITHACCVTALISVFVGDRTLLTITLVVLSFTFWLLDELLKRRILSGIDKKLKNIESEHLGEVVKVIEPIDTFHGAVLVQNERKNAYSDCDDPIPVNAEVKIIADVGSAFLVERI